MGEKYFLMQYKCEADASSWGQQNYLVLTTSKLIIININTFCNICFHFLLSINLDTSALLCPLFHLVNCLLPDWASCPGWMGPNFTTLIAELFRLLVGMVRCFITKYFVHLESSSNFVMLCGSLGIECRIRIPILDQVFGLKRNCTIGVFKHPRVATNLIFNELTLIFYI